MRVGPMPSLPTASAPTASAPIAFAPTATAPIAATTTDNAPIATRHFMLHAFDRASRASGRLARGWRTAPPITKR